MFSFKVALVLFLIGLIGLGLALFGDLPNRWTLVSAGLGISAWLISAIWGFIDKTYVMVHHLKRSRAIDTQYKAERSEEKNQVIQRGKSQAKKRVAKKRLKLWLDTILGVRN